MKTQDFFRRLVRCLLVAFTVFTLVAFFGLQTASAESSAFVRIIHASPDVGTADLFMDGQKILSNFQFATVTGYAPVKTGPHKVQVALIGTGADAAVLTQTITVQPNTTYTVAAIGVKSTGFSLEVITDDNSITGNLVKVRVYHLSPGSGTVDVTAGNNMIASGLGYEQASSYVSIPAGQYTFDVTPSQTQQTMPVSATLKTGTVTSIFAVGVLNGSPKFQVVNTQVMGTPGVPGTGSDPNALPSPSQAQTLISWYWILGLLTLLAMAAVVATRRRAR